MSVTGCHGVTGVTHGVTPPSLPRDPSMSLSTSEGKEMLEEYRYTHVRAARFSGGRA